MVLALSCQSFALSISGTAGFVPSQERPSSKSLGLKIQIDSAESVSGDLPLFVDTIALCIGTTMVCGGLGPETKYRNAIRTGVKVPCSADV